MFLCKFFMLSNADPKVLASKVYTSPQLLHLAELTKVKVRLNDAKYLLHRDFDVGYVSWLFAVLQWNLIARSDTVSFVQWDHISLNQDSLCIRRKKKIKLMPPERKPMRMLNWKALLR